MPGTKDENVYEKTSMGSKKKKKKSKFNKRLIKLFITLFLWVFAVGLIYVVITVASATSENIDIDGYLRNYSGQIFYENPKTGNYENLDNIYLNENRVWVSITEMPKHLKDAAVAIEDERFYEHGGVDLKRTFGAFIYYIIDKESAYGGSTITQQLVKNVTGQDDRSVTRKVKEIWNSFRLEKQMSKEQILELYLNTIYLSQGCNGVGAASRIYFNKEPMELTVAEAAAIVGITQYPTRYDPFLNPENNKEKQKLVLKKMYELEYITKDEYEEALNEKLNLITENLNDGKNYNSYFVDQVITEVADDLVEQKGYDRETALKLIHTGGFEIYATIDPSIQRKMDSVYIDTSNFPHSGVQSSMVVMDPYTGQVKGISGGVGRKSGDFVLNRATMSPRQPGSSIKPISVYAPALEYGIISPMSVRVDQSTTFYKGQPHEWTPKNSGNKFEGPVTIQYAVQRSLNTIAAQVLDELGIEKSRKFMTDKLGITTLSKNDGLSGLSLGGLTNGITTYEMTAAYSAFVNNGVYIEPHTYTKVIDNMGRVILEKKPKKIYAMSSETAQNMCRMLYRVVTYGTGTEAGLSTVMVGGKTGTTDDNKDRWFVGITPYYVSAVWYGYDEPKALSSITGNPAAQTWKKVMSKVHEGLSYKSLPLGDNMISVDICSVTGKVAAPTCIDENKESTAVTTNVPYSSAPTEICVPSEVHPDFSMEENPQGEITEGDIVPETDVNIETPDAENTQQAA